LCNYKRALLSGELVAQRKASAARGKVPGGVGGWQTPQTKLRINALHC